MVYPPQVSRVGIKGMQVQEAAVTYCGLQDPFSGDRPFSTGVCPRGIGSGIREYAHRTATGNPRNLRHQSKAAKSWRTTGNQYSGARFRCRPDEGRQWFGCSNVSIKVRLPMKMLLQIHDELVLETPRSTRQSIRGDCL